MVDDAFEDAALASLYDVLNPWARSDEYYLGLVRSADAVLDVGCGTGTLLQRARNAGHRGRLCGLDPAVGMLDRARRHPDIEWVQAELPAMGYRHEFDLIVMTGHAFQVLLTDDDVLAVLTAVRDALTDGGHFAFETRNPVAHAWERWTPDNAVEVRDERGELVRVWHEVESVEHGVVTSTEVFERPSRPRAISRTRLRFLPAGTLDALLVQAGLAVDERYGNWDRCPFTPHSPEIITMARRAADSG